MKSLAHVGAILVIGSVSGCADPNTVLFVTNSSLGINFDSKPPTANIAYDRVEGYIGPRYSNGAAPPVVSSFETGGNIFAPQVRQTYATGAAAMKATKGPTAPDGPSELSGDPNQKQLMFFGTATTIGLKVGFGTTGALPDSVLFGYRRKEASVIPLGETKQQDGTVKAVYPSTIAAIDTNTNTTDPTNTGITSKQFIATGQAAEALATNNPVIAAAFAIKAENAALAGLTPAEAAKAKAAGIEDANTAKNRLSKITDFVTASDGSLDKAKLVTLVTAAREANPKAVPPGIENSATVGALLDKIGSLQPTINALFTAIPSKS